MAVTKEGAHGLTMGLLQAIYGKGWQISGEVGCPGSWVARRRNEQMSKPKPVAAKTIQRRFRHTRDGFWIVLIEKDKLSHESRWQESRVAITEDELKLLARKYIR